MVAAPEAGPGRLANGDSMHKVRVVVSMGCVNFEGAVKPGPASQRLALPAVLEGPFVSVASYIHWID